MKWALRTVRTYLTYNTFCRMEYELSMRQTAEADVARLRKLLDDTNIIRLHLESDIESLKEELITLKKNHEIVRDISQKVSVLRPLPLAYSN